MFYNDIKKNLPSACQDVSSNTEHNRHSDDISDEAEDDDNDCNSEHNRAYFKTSLLAKFAGNDSEKIITNLC